MKKLKLKNSQDTVMIDDKTYDFIKSQEYFKKIDFLDNLRQHASGYAFYQKNWRFSKGVYKNETIYLHKLVAANFVGEHNKKGRVYVKFGNGNVLDCRLENISWDSFENSKKDQKPHSQLGYAGVKKEGKKYKSLYDNKVIGEYNTPEEAAFETQKKIAGII